MRFPLFYTKKKKANFLTHSTLNIFQNLSSYFSLIYYYFSAKNIKDTIFSLFESNNCIFFKMFSDIEQYEVNCFKFGKFNMTDPNRRTRILKIAS